jgi:hypothetical protein
MIQTRTRTVYFATTKGRSYIRKASAIRAETIAIIKAKYPTERGDGSDGYHTWTWRDLKNSDVLYRRLRRIVARSVQP